MWDSGIWDLRIFEQRDTLISSTKGFLTIKSKIITTRKLLILHKLSILEQVLYN